MGRSLVLFCVSTLVIGGCSLFTSLDGLQGGASDGGPGSGNGDGSVSGSEGGTKNDGGTFGDGSTSGDGGPTNLILNGSFEEGAVGCGGTWSGGYGASYTLVGDARTGSKACMVCPLTSGESSYALQLTNPLTLGPGAYHAETWIRAPLDAGAAAMAGVLPYAIPSDGGSIVYYQGTEVTPDIVWVESTEDFTLTDTTQLTVQTHCFDPNGDGCILVDDMALYGP